MEPLYDDSMLALDKKEMVPKKLFAFMEFVIKRQTHKQLQNNVQIARAWIGVKFYRKRNRNKGILELRLPIQLNII